MVWREAGRMGRRLMFAIANVPRENRKTASMRGIMMSMTCTRELTRESCSLFLDY